MLGNKLDKKFQHMNYGETVGLPQGNTVSDLISEILLAYVDAILVLTLKKYGLTGKDYKILRYRDDYRILTQNLENKNKIKKELIVILQRYKLNLGELKTLSYGDIINGSISDDKKYWIEHDPVIKITTDKFYRFPKVLFKTIFTKIKSKRYSKSIGQLWKTNTHNRIYKTTLQKHLYTIKSFSDLYPNSGQLIGALKEFKERISDFKYEDFEKSGTDIIVLIVILIDVIQKNPKITQTGISLLSVLLNKIDYEIDDKKYEELRLLRIQWLEDYFQNDFKSTSQFPTVIESYEYKFTLISEILKLKNYNDYLEIWLQRIIVKNMDSNSKLITDYINNSKNELVRLFNSIILKNKGNQLFNEEWLEEDYKLDITKFVNTVEVDSLSAIISNNEISICEYQDSL
jgi:hypothetical protein